MTDDKNTLEFDDEVELDFEDADSDYDEEAVATEQGTEETELDFDDEQSDFEDADSSFEDSDSSDFDEGQSDFEDADSSFENADSSDDSSDFDNTYEENAARKAKRDEKAKQAYDATFSGEEQLEHSLHQLSTKLKMTTETIRLECLVPSNFKKQSRSKTIIGLNGSVSQWGVVNPVHVMKLEDEGSYLILDGLRRVYAAMKNGLDEIECRVWDFEDKVQGKKLANVISLMINRTERYLPIEQWQMQTILEDVNELTPGLMEYLLQMEPGQAMKLKDIMLCEEDYFELRDKLVNGEGDIEGIYKKLCNERKKIDRLEKEDNSAIANTVSDAIAPADDIQRRSDDEVQDMLGLEETGAAVKEKKPRPKLSDDEVRGLLDMAEEPVSSEDIEAMDMTNEIRGNDKYQTTDERHPVEKEIKQATFIRDNFHCRCCGIGGTQWLGVLVFHHAIPVYAGGPDTVENGLTLCQNCHMTLHNYILGKVQLDTASLSEGQKKVFSNIFKFGNIALDAVKKQGISRDKLKNIDKTGTQHAYPDANIKENTMLYTKAAMSSDNETTENSDDVVVEDGDEANEE